MSLRCFSDWKFNLYVSPGWLLLLSSDDKIIFVSWIAFKINILHVCNSNMNNIHLKTKIHLFSARYFVNSKLIFFGNIKPTIFLHELQILLWNVKLRNEMETFRKVSKSCAESEGDEERTRQTTPDMVWHLENMIKNSNQTPSITRLKFASLLEFKVCVCGLMSTKFISGKWQLDSDPLYSKSTHIR